MNDLYLRSDADRGGAGLYLRSYAGKLSPEQYAGGAAPAMWWMARIRPPRLSKRRLKDELVELELIDIL